VLCAFAGGINDYHGRAISNLDCFKHVKRFSADYRDVVVETIRDIDESAVRSDRDVGGTVTERDFAYDRKGIDIDDRKGL